MDTRPSARRTWPLTAAVLAVAWLPEWVLGAAFLTAALLLRVDWLVVIPALALLRGPVLAAFGRRPLPGRALRPADEPELAALVRDVADRVGLRRPLLVRVVPDVQASLGPARVDGTPSYVLLLGLPLLRTLTEAELASVVAHELAHEQQARARGTAVLGFARELLAERLAGYLRPLAPLAAPLLRASQPLVWRAELAADAQAARIAGGTATVDALRRTAVLHAVYDGLGETWWSALAEEDAFPEDFYDALDAALADPHVVARAARTAAADDAVDPHASAGHPPFARRIEALADAPEAAGTYGTAPLPLRTGAALARWCVRELAELEEVEVIDGEATRVRLLDLPDDRLHELGGTPGLDLLLHVTGEQHPLPALTAVLDAVADGRGQQLARRLEPGLRWLDAEARAALAREVLTGAGTTALTAVLHAAGWTYAGRWLTSVLTAPDGRVVDLHALVGEAVDSGDTGPVRTLLGPLADKEGTHA
ncbi:M48 family metalloprotease [Streptomyces griseosporeus]|uniref:M48 family metalloprotease n=1 Tax=Streptomyces griseosporeus TaxID=1910 RepID=UPI0037002F26